MDQKKKIPRLKITLSGTDYSLNISKDVVRVLGIPSHICLLKSLDGSSVAIQACKANVTMSFKVPDVSSWTKNTHIRIYSREFVHEVLANNGSTNIETITLYGNYDQKKNAVIFENKREK